MKKIIIVSAFFFACLAGLLYAYRAKQEHIVIAIAVDDALRGYSSDVRIAVLSLSEREVRRVEIEYNSLFSRNFDFLSAEKGKIKGAAHIKISVKKLGLSDAEVLCGDFHVGLSGSTYILYFRKYSGRWVLAKKELYEIS